MATATTHVYDSDGREHADRHLAGSAETLPTLPMFETAQLASMRNRTWSKPGRGKESFADTETGWLRLDE